MPYFLRCSLPGIVSLTLGLCGSPLRADPALPNAAAETPGQTASANSATTRAPELYSRERLLADLSRAVAAHFNLEGDLQLELLRAWPAPAHAASEWELLVLEFPAATSSSMMVRCRLLGDAVPVTETTFVVRAQLWRDAWASRQPLGAGAAFDASLLEVRRVDVLRDREALPATAGDHAFVFSRSVPAGRLLTWRDIARRPLVKKGDLVEVSAVDGPLVVTMKALAMENGAQGETVTVRNPESRKDFAARVVDVNRVQVRF